MYSLPARTKRLIDCSFKAIEFDLTQSKTIKPKANLTRKERQALRSLKRNKDIIITKADKGDTTVVMNTSCLIALAHKHLADQSTYQLLKEDPTQEVRSRFNQYLIMCRDKGSISQRQLTELKLPQDTSTQVMYFLPKLHKNPLKLRPIISCTNGPTYTASAFLDKLLQLHMKATKSFPKKFHGTSKNT